MPSNSARREGMIFSLIRLIAFEANLQNKGPVESLVFVRNLRLIFLFLGLFSIENGEKRNAGLLGF